MALDTGHIGLFGTQQASGSVIGKSTSKAGDIQLGLSSKHLFRHEGHRVSGMTHGDDLVLTGPTDWLTELKNTMMPWIHTWEVDEDIGETKAKARLVVQGFADLDLTEIRSESPARSRLSRRLILQNAYSQGFRLRKGDVKTALLSGDREDARREVYAEPHKSCARNCKSRGNKC